MPDIGGNEVGDSPSAEGRDRGKNFGGERNRRENREISRREFYSRHADAEFDFVPAKEGEGVDCEGGMEGTDYEGGIRIIGGSHSEWGRN